jgi:hypothetical protein
VVLPPVLATDSIRGTPSQAGTWSNPIPIRANALADVTRLDVRRVNVVGTAGAAILGRS